MLDHIIPAHVPSLLLIPYRPAQKRLHPPWRRIARVFRQFPTILALGAADQPFEKETDLSSWLVPMDMMSQGWSASLFQA